jgi:hypothetical protein
MKVEGGRWKVEGGRSYIMYEFVIETICGYSEYTRKRCFKFIDILHKIHLRLIYAMRSPG